MKSLKKFSTCLLLLSVLFVMGGKNHVMAANDEGEDKKQKLQTLWENYQNLLNSPHDPADDVRIQSAYSVAVDEVNNESGPSNSRSAAQKNLFNILYYDPTRSEVLSVIAPDVQPSDLKSEIERIIPQMLAHTTYEVFFRQAYFDLYLKGRRETVMVERAGVKHEVLLTNISLLNNEALQGHLTQHPEIMKELANDRSRQLHFANDMLDTKIPLYSGAFEKKINATVTADPHLVTIFDLLSKKLPLPEDLPEGVTMNDYKQTLAKQIGEEFKGVAEGANKELARRETKEEMSARYGGHGLGFLDQSLNDQILAGALTPEETNTKILDELEKIANLKNSGGSESQIEAHKVIITSIIQALIRGKDHETIKQLAHASGLSGRTLGMRLRNEAGINALAIMREEAQTSAPSELGK